MFSAPHNKGSIPTVRMRKQVCRGAWVTKMTQSKPNLFAFPAYVLTITFSNFVFNDVKAHNLEQNTQYTGVTWPMCLFPFLSTLLTCVVKDGGTFLCRTTTPNEEASEERMRHVSADASRACLCTDGCVSLPRSWGWVSAVPLPSPSGIQPLQLRFRGVVVCFTGLREVFISVNLINFIYKRKNTFPLAQLRPEPSLLPPRCTLAGN